MLDPRTPLLKHLLVALFALAAPAAQAQISWTGATSGNWNTSNNWSLIRVPNTSEVVTFPAAGANKAMLNNRPAGTNFSNLSFTGSGYSLLSTGNSLTLGAGITASHASGTNTLSSDIVLGAPQSFALTGAGDLTVTNVDNGGHTLTLNNSSTGTLRLNGVLSGSGKIIKDGSGRVELGGGAANTYSGNTTIVAGELRLAKSTGNAIPGGLITIGNGPSASSLTTSGAEKIGNAVAVTVLPNGSFLPGGTESIGSLTLNGGTVNSGAFTLKLAGNLTANASATVAGTALEFTGPTRQIITPAGVELTVAGLLVSSSGSPLTLTKTGPGTLLCGDFAVGSFIAAEGIVQVDGVDDLSTAFFTQGSAVLRGVGEFFLLDASGGGAIEPGSPSSTAGEEMRAHDFIGGAGATYRPSIDEGGSDTLRVEATLNLGGMQLAPEIDFLPVLGEVYPIVRKQSAGVTASRFMQGGTVLEEGARVTTPLAHFSISYQGGDGNDITLTAIPVSPSGNTRVWDGGGANSMWTNAANWVGDIAPVAGDSLDLSGRNGRTNDYPAGMVFHSLRIAIIDGGSLPSGINGNPIQLTGDILAEGGGNTLGFLSISIHITLLSNASIISRSSNGAGILLRFDQGIVTTTPTLTFRGGNNAFQHSIGFFGSGLLSGPAQCVVDENVGVDFGSAAHTFVGGTVIRNGHIIGDILGAAGRGLTVGDGSVSATAELTASASNIPTVTVNAGSTLNIVGAPQVGIGSLLINDGTVIGENLAVGGDLELNGSDSFTATSLSCGDFTHAGGTFTITEWLDCANFSQVGSQTLGTLNVSGGVTLPPSSTLNVAALVSPGGGPSTLHTLDLRSGSRLFAETLGDPALANQRFLLTGGGTLEVGTLLASDELTVALGTLEQNGTVPPFAFEGAVTLNGGVVSGTGRLRSLQAQSGGGVVRPGSTATGGLGSLQIDGSGTVFNSSTQVQFDIQGAAVESAYDQLAMGDFTLSNPALAVTLDPAYTPLVGQEFVLVRHNFDARPFPGTFNGIAEGTTETFHSGVVMTYSYVGGDGNDFSATVTSSPAGEFRIWDGGGADNHWMTAQNWVGDIAPQIGEALRFPAGAARPASQNNFPVGTEFRTIVIEGGHTLSGDPIILSDDLTGSVASGSSEILIPILMRGGDDFAATVELQGAGSLIVSGDLTLTDSTLLTLRRTDPSGTLFGSLDTRAILKDIGASSIGVVVDGGGRVRFLPGTRDYDRPTEVLHGTLAFAGGSVPGDLAIGGSSGAAVVENPGGSIPDTATLTLLPNGTHSMVGATPTEKVGALLYAGGTRTQPGSAIFEVGDFVRVEVDTNIDTSIVFDVENGDPDDIFEVLNGATTTLNATVGRKNGQTLTLRKFGAGTLVVAAPFNVDTLSIEEGIVAVLTNQAVVPVQLRGGSLAGSATTAWGLTGTPDGGSIAPGGLNAATRLGRLTLGRNFVADPSTVLALEIGGTTAGTQHDQLIFASGASTVNLNSSQLDLTLVDGFEPSPGAAFTLIDKQTAGAVTGTFANKPEGQTFQAAGFEWTITYLGGDGNDVVLTAGAEASENPLALSAVAITPAAPGSPASIAGTITGGTPNGVVFVQASTDLGAADLWTTIATIPLDASGSATFSAVVDPDSVGAGRNFFRLRAN